MLKYLPEQAEIQHDVSCCFAKDSHNEKRKRTNKVEKKFSTRLSYPDPFKPVGIEFELPQDATVTVKIFDEKGTVLTTIISDTKYNAGVHFLRLHLQDYYGKMYSYRLVAEGKSGIFSETKRIA